MALVGSDSYINSVLVPYVDQFSAKSPDWQHYIKFLVVPLGGYIQGRRETKLEKKSCEYN